MANIRVYKLLKLGASGVTISIKIGLMIKQDFIELLTTTLYVNKEQRFFIMTSYKGLCFALRYL